MNNISTEGRVVLDSYLKVPRPKNISDYLLKNGDILFNNTNSVDLIGKTAIFKGEIIPCTYSNHLTRLRLNLDKAIPEYVLYHMIRRWEQRYFYSICNRHVGQAGIKSSDIRRIKIAIAPLDEQHKIASVLSTVDEAIQKTNEVVGKAEMLKQGLMQRLLTRGIGHTVFRQTELGEIPETWSLRKLGDNKIAEIIMGQSPPSSSYNKDRKGLPFLQGNAQFGRINPSPYIYTTSPQKIAEKDDVLISVRAPVGELNITPFKCCIGRGLCAIRPKNSMLDVMFIFYYLRKNIQRLLRLETGSTFKAIRKKDLSEFKVSVPPISEQRRIADFLMACDKKIGIELNQKAQFENLKKGLMQVLLTGKVRVKVD